MIPTGRSFYKMSGSGNDFVMIDARSEDRGGFDELEVVQRICRRGTGVGADGIVFIERSKAADVRLTYFNADGSLADFCGNATLCTARLAAELGAGPAEGMTIETDSGLVSARLRDGHPEIDLQPVSDVRPTVEIPLQEGESRIGFCQVGVPHLVIRCDDVSTIDVVGRGRPLRSHPTLAAGANVNFISKGPRGQWRYRTYERGVEGETLACGSGAVAAAILVRLWSEGSDLIQLETRSGCTLSVRLATRGSHWMASLGGEGRVVYRGSLSEL